MSEPGYFHSYLRQQMDCDSCGERVDVFAVNQCNASACHARMCLYRGLGDRGFIHEEENTEMESPTQHKPSAPRITQAEVDGAIVGETYTLLPSGRVTVCELTLRNGFTVRGDSAVVFIENFDAEIGRKVARTRAVEQVWQLLGYALRERGYEPAF